MSVTDLYIDHATHTMRLQQGGPRSRGFFPNKITIIGDELFTGGTFDIGGDTPKNAAPWLILPDTFDYQVPFRIGLNWKHLRKPGTYTATVKATKDNGQVTFDVTVEVGPPMK